MKPLAIALCLAIALLAILAYPSSAPSRPTRDECLRELDQRDRREIAKCINHPIQVYIYVGDGLGYRTGEYVESNLDDCIFFQMMDQHSSCAGHR